MESSFNSLLRELQNCCLCAVTAGGQPGVSRRLMAAFKCPSTCFSVTLLFSLVMPVFRLQLPRILVNPFYILNADFFQDFFQVTLKTKKVPQRRLSRQKITLKIT